MTSPCPSAVVSGGSLSGLMAGLVLRELGYRVTIYERASTVESQGAGIVLGRFSKAFFAKFDKTRTVLGVSAARRHFCFSDGSTMASEQIDLVMTSWDKLYYVLRSNFDGLQQPGYLDNDLPPSNTDNTPPCSYHMGHTVISHTYDSATGTVHIKYKTGGEQLETQAQLFICAEGPSSNIRKTLFPDVERTYSGYLAFRGLAPESELSSEALAELMGSLTFVHSRGTQFLCYGIPGTNGSITKGSRQMNFVWYNNFAQDSAELDKVMTDKDGQRHINSVSAGKVPQNVLEEEILPRGRAFLPPHCLEVLEKTSEPFIQLVTDVISPSAVFADGHVLLVGDALCGVRPHTTASTNQAAEHALSLFEALRPNPSILSSLYEEWQPGRMQYAHALFNIGSEIGHASQFTHHPMSVDIQISNEDRYLPAHLKVGEPK